MKIRDNYYEKIVKLIGEGYFTSREIYEKLKPSSRRTFFRSIRDLLDEGVIVRVEKGVYVLSEPQKPFEILRRENVARGMDKFIDGFKGYAYLAPRFPTKNSRKLMASYLVRIGLLGLAIFYLDNLLKILEAGEDGARREYREGFLKFTGDLVDYSVYALRESRSRSVIREAKFMKNALIEECLGLGEDMVKTARRIKSHIHR
jgi:hypothetical protein